MAAFTCTATSFSGKIDSRGRITIPAGIRNSLGLVEGDKVDLEISDSRKIRKSFDNRTDALNFLSQIDEEIERFSYDGEILEVVLSE